MIAASSTHKNPIVYSFKKNLDRCMDLIPENIKETKVNEPLINWHSFDGNEALYSIRASRGAAYDISDEKMIRLSQLLKVKEGLHVLPASTAGLAALFGLHAEESLEADRYVVLLTGKK
jgi:threonine synthase